MIYFELFYTFFLIGLFTFGGGYAMIPMITNEVVDKHHWISLDTLTDFIAVSEVTPGPFAINISTFIGSEVGGVLGAVLSTIGVILPSTIIIILVAIVLSKFLKSRFVKGALRGVQPIILALILSTAFVFFLRNVLLISVNNYQVSFGFERASFAILLLLVMIYVVYKAKYKRGLNPLLILLISAVLGIIAFSY